MLYSPQPPRPLSLHYNFSGQWTHVWFPFPSKPPTYHPLYPFRVLTVVGLSSRYLFLGSLYSSFFPFVPHSFCLSFFFFLLFPIWFSEKEIGKGVDSQGKGVVYEWVHPGIQDGLLSDLGTQQPKLVLGYLVRPLDPNLVISLFWDTELPSGPFLNSHLWVSTPSLV